MYSNTIEIETQSFRVHLELNSLISVVTGNSSTGKTFLVKMIELARENNGAAVIKSNININDIITCRTENDIEVLLYKKDTLKGKTIFIDRYDYFHSEELNNFILSAANRIILMSHTFYEELNLHAESFILINYDAEKRIFYTEKLIDHLDPAEELI